jgi:hypothetical protein
MRNVHVFKRYWKLLPHRDFCKVFFPSLELKLSDILCHERKKYYWTTQINKLLNCRTNTEYKKICFCLVMMFNATFNNISAISWRSVILVEETIFLHSSYMMNKNKIEIADLTAMPFANLYHVQTWELYP